MPARPTVAQSNDPAPMRFAVFGDLHLYRLLAWPWELVGKRSLGLANLWVSRRARLAIELVPDLVARITEIQPDFVLGTGDLTTTALNSEFAEARRHLDPLVTRFRTLLLPGNHDRYTYTSHFHRRFEQHFAPCCPAVYPYVQRLGPRLVLIALDATRPTPINARGRHGKAQREAFAAALGEQVGEGDRLIVANHYPIGTPPDHERESVFHGLGDKRQLVDLLARGPQTLYLHGHIHHPWVWPHDRAANVLTVNVGAPVMRNREFPFGQGFWEILVDPAAGAPWRLVHHVMSGPGRWQTAEASIDSAPARTGDGASTAAEQARAEAATSAT